MGVYKQERDAILEKFGKEIKRRRKEKGVSQKAFGRIAKIHPNEVGAIERGEREPGLLMLLILSKATGASVEKLVRGLPTPTERKPRPLAEDDAPDKDAP